MTINIIAEIDDLDSDEVRRIKDTLYDINVNIIEIKEIEE